jgi:probable rRNA maturation factor
MSIFLPSNSFAFKLHISNFKLRTSKVSRYQIEIADQQTQLFDETGLIAAVEMILEDYNILESEISIAVVDDPTMREHNNRWLQHDYETDVLSFLLEYDDNRAFLSGQLIVSTDTAQSMATELGMTMEQELLLYVVHGTLHLVGLDDKSEESAIEMRGAEQEYFQRLGIEYRWTEIETSKKDVTKDPTRKTE